jgi:hypothetical protein
VQARLKLYEEVSTGHTQASVGGVWKKRWWQSLLPAWKGLRCSSHAATRGFPRFLPRRQPQLGVIPMQQPHAVGTGAPENPGTQISNQSNGSQVARASGTTGGPNEAAQRGAASASIDYQADHVTQPSLIDIGGLCLPLSYSNNCLPPRPVKEKLRKKCSCWIPRY